MQVILTLLLILFPAVSFAEFQESDRYFRLEVAVDVGAIPSGKGPVDIFVPLAKSDSRQEILSREIDSSIPGNVRKDSEYENDYYHAHLDTADEKPISLKVKYRVRRAEFHKNTRSSSITAAYDPNELEKLRRYLQGDNLAPVSGEIVEQAQRNLKLKGTRPSDRVREIFQYVVDTMEFRKDGTGWGNGDLYFAATQKYGDCTDFTALFIALSRADKIPARFVGGYEIPANLEQGDITDYHCWADVWLPGIGWVPADTVAADRNSALSEFSLGSQKADRIQMSVGRDIPLGAPDAAKAVNMFLLPLVEVQGEKFADVKVKVSFAPLEDADRNPSPVINVPEDFQAPVSKNRKSKNR